ncbi:hypothetical protein [Nannocystis pusilla]|uniref:Uncharacterized protein n=1 Tax=Nannocystis pusilla TaxID=889268 RepID=A0ABS7TMZ3_9BACT|nr:hypothetical protein [Nannocystis pusilla]MBZ5709456.1 hypothetical protein [Nannocystis pusilla]
MNGKTTVVFTVATAGIGRGRDRAALAELRGEARARLAAPQRLALDRRHDGPSITISA